MSTNVRVTLIGLYNYDSTLFDGLTLPTAYDKSDFINTLLLEHGEKCVLYADPVFMKFSIGALGRKWYHELERIALALNDTYNPLHNYDRTEEYSDQIYGLNSEATTGWKGGGSTRTNNPEYFSEQLTNGYTDQVTAGYSNQTTPGSTETITAATTERTVSAFNSSSYEPSEKVTENGGKQQTTAGKTETSTGKTETNAGKMKYSGKTEDIAENFGENSNGSVSGSEQKTITHNAHLFGNIGITTSQQMLEAELELRREYNLYAVAAGIFANELLINVF